MAPLSNRRRYGNPAHQPLAELRDDPRASQRAEARQAPARHPQPHPDHQGRQAGDDSLHARRRQSGPGPPASHPEHPRLRHEPARSRRSAALPDRAFLQFLRQSRIRARQAEPRRPDSQVHHRCFECSRPSRDRRRRLEQLVGSYGHLVSRRCAQRRCRSATRPLRLRPVAIRLSFGGQLRLKRLLLSTAAFCLCLFGASSVYEFNMNSIDGKPPPLASYKGKVLLLVNVASHCGFTPQYKELEAVYEKYKDRGLVVIGFPANNFMGQEPGTNEEIKTFCTRTYNVSFPLYSKISVKGDDTAPLYKYLTDKSANPETGGDIKWNFTKFLVGRDGKILNRFEPSVKPDAAQVISAVEKALQ